MLIEKMGGWQDSDTPASVQTDKSDMAHSDHTFMLMWDFLPC